jgi:hypothetical protein
MASLGDVAEFRWKARKSATRASSEECARLRQGPRFPRADRKTARRDESRIAEASRAPMTRVQSRSLRYGDSSNFVGLPRKRHKIPPIEQSRHFTGALSQATRRRRRTTATAELIKKHCVEPPLDRLKAESFDGPTIAKRPCVGGSETRAPTA